MSTYLFAGASSAIALQTCQILQAKGHKVIGISTKEIIEPYDKIYTVKNYLQGSYPVLNETIDGLVYFPGTINLKPFHRLSIEEFKHDYEINALGAVCFLQFYLTALKESLHPSIVLFSSVAAQQGMLFHSSITMAKAAVEGLTRSLAADLAPKIRVNCIAPSLTDTPLSERLINTQEKIDNLKKRNPLQKIGSTTDLANAVIFLLSEDAGWITGQVLAVDGGMGSLKL
ncbi:MAG: SDR family oxidoreductase [Cytophagaceae bacterium]|nr:SDR family oxidoreductase [Cytophagaceae bacterium]